MLQIHNALRSICIMTGDVKDIIGQSFGHYYEMLCWWHCFGQVIDVEALGVALSLVLRAARKPATVDAIKLWRLSP